MGLSLPCRSPLRRTLLALHVVFNAFSRSCSVSFSSHSFQTKQSQMQLASGVTAEVLSSSPSFLRGSENKKPPLLFVHGSFHSSWCWAEHYFPFFVEQGYPVSALSLRGTGGTYAGDGVKKVKIDEHVDDIASFLTAMKEKDQRGWSGVVSPVLVGHSFGGLAIMKYLERDPEKSRENVSGFAVMCSVPPSGNGKMTIRYMGRSLRDSWKITAGLAMKKCITDKKLCRELFFGGTESENGMSDNDIERYQKYFKRDTVATIDLSDLARKLPSRFVSKDGRALYVSDLPPCVVMGATDDFIVDLEGTLETATFFGVDPVLVDSPHDVMLGSKWQNGADALLRWLEEEIVSCKNA